MIRLPFSLADFCLLRDSKMERTLTMLWTECDPLPPSSGTFSYDWGSGRDVSQ